MVHGSGRVSTYVAHHRHVHIEEVLVGKVFEIHQQQTHPQVSAHARTYNKTTPQHNTLRQVIL